MKKLLCLFICLFCVVGCSCNRDKANDAVEKYLNNYKSLHESVLKNIEDVVTGEILEDKDKDTYKEVLKRQYRDLMYTIENESYNGDKAYVTVKLTVYDLYKAQKNAEEYKAAHEDEFKTNDTYDNKKFTEYKLKQMKETKDTIEYTVVFDVTKKDGKWYVEQPSDEILEKIHGIYNYEEK